MSEKSTTVRFQRLAPSLVSALSPALAARWLEGLFTTPSKPAAKPSELDLLFRAHRAELVFDSWRTLPIYTWGDGPTVLLVHGWSSRASRLSAYVEPLVARGFRVVAFDHPAHGDAHGTRTALPELAVAVERVATRVGPLYGIIAHSLGAAATSLAIARGVRADRLVYLAPPEDLAGYLSRLARAVGFPASIAARAQRRIERRYGLPFEHARGGFLAQNVDAPLLVVHDFDDDEVPYTEGKTLAQTWAGPAQLVSTIGLGHNRLVRSDEVVHAAVTFVAAREEPAHGVADHRPPLPIAAAS